MEGPGKWSARGPRWLSAGLVIGGSVITVKVHLCKSSSRSAQQFRFRACVALRTKSVFSASFFSIFPFFKVLAIRYSQGP